MSRFIKLSYDDETCIINVDRIVGCATIELDGRIFTRVRVFNSDDIWYNVDQTPEEILELINELEQ